MNRLRFLFVISAICVLRGTAQPLLAKGDTFIVVIDAGHGGKDPGAKGVKTNEKTINLAVALKLGKMIAAGHDDVQVIYTRKTDKFVELSERANIANRNKADLFISIHTNSLKKKKCFGKRGRNVYPRSGKDARKFRSCHAGKLCYSVRREL